MTNIWFVKFAEFVVSCLPDWKKKCSVIATLEGSLPSLSGTVAQPLPRRKIGHEHVIVELNQKGAAEKHRLDSFACRMSRCEVVQQNHYHIVHRA